jgi:hypothetical protein
VSEELCPTCTFPKSWLGVHDECDFEDIGDRHTDPAGAVPEDLGQDKYEAE